jgi:pyruvate ferredoxin oxidoreductase beta subunit/2-oxoisovalerate ferredoxin oxidoreductase beta subunit
MSSFFKYYGNVKKEEYMNPGHLACQGCAATIAMRLAIKELGENTVVVVPACCWTIIDGAYPSHSLKVPLFHTAFETSAVVASGIKSGLRMRGKEDTTVMAWAGDGGTFDIGLQALSGVAERNDDIIYVVYDNEAYMNTGIQRSSATPYGAWTTTTPKNAPENRPKKNMMQIMEAHSIPYLATATIAYPKDLMNKFRKAKQIKGTRFIHILSPCPPGWKYPPNLTVRLSRLAVMTRFFPLYEIEDYGEKLTINYNPKPLPVKEYLSLQGRFRHLRKEDIELIQKEIDRNWDRLEKRHIETYNTLDNIPTELYS